MQASRYIMRDLNEPKIDKIMEFNVALRRNRSRSLFEFGLFCTALGIYLGVLTLSN